MKNVAIITARGGSKRIPGKNIKDFLGKPLITYSIEAALASKIFEEVIVSTDCPEIANIADNSGASVPFMRSAKNADDFSTTADVLFEVIESLERRGKSFDHFCCIYPTAPFITSEKIENSFNLMIDGGYDSCLLISEFGYPIQRSLKIEDNRISMTYPEYEQTRSQELDPRYHDVGQLYWCGCESFKRNKTVFTKNTTALVVSELESQDIDTITDWKLAELKYQLMRKGN